MLVDWKKLSKDKANTSAIFRQSAIKVTYYKNDERVWITELNILLKRNSVFDIQHPSSGINYREFKRFIKLPFIFFLSCYYALLYLSLF